jgi:hypothetical protein
VLSSPRANGTSSIGRLRDSRGTPARHSNETRELLAVNSPPIPPVRP